MSAAIDDVDDLGSGFESEDHGPDENLAAAGEPRPMPRTPPADLLAGRSRASMPAERGHSRSAGEDDEVDELDDDFDEEFDDDFEAELGGEYEYEDLEDDVPEACDLESCELVPAEEGGDIGEAFEEVEVDGEGDLDPGDDFGENIM